MAQPVQTEGLDDPARQVHWAMGAFFGTGWYQVEENRSMYIFRVPPRQILREPVLGKDGRRTLGIQIQYPLTFGLHDLKDIPDFLDFDNYATISFTPGIQLEVPVTDKWDLKPYINLGWGIETNSSESAWIYYGGIRSRYRLGDGRFNWSLLNGAYFAGYKPEFEDRGKFGSVMAGLEFEQPLANLLTNRDDLFLNWQVTYNYFFDLLNFHYDDDSVESINDQWELGLALGKGDKRFKLWIFSFEQFGLSYKWSSNRRYRAITLNFTSPFNR